MRERDCVCERWLVLAMLAEYCLLRQIWSVSGIFHRDCGQCIEILDEHKPGSPKHHTTFGTLRSSMKCHPWHTEKKGMGEKLR